MTTNAPLIDNFAEPCVMMEKGRVPDGQGGFLLKWKEGARFNASIVKDKTLAARVAEKQGVTDIYSVYTGVGIQLEFHEVFKRIEDGATFRATSNYTDSRPPKGATFAFEVVTAERWELPA